MLPHCLGVGLDQFVDLFLGLELGKSAKM